jgi:hypothetical protein
MNVTVTKPSASGFLTAYPAGTAQPTASNLNFNEGQTVPNLVTVKVGSDGKVALANNSPGTVHVLADVAGYYLSGGPNTRGAFVAVDPLRLLDTRAGTGSSRVSLRPNTSLDVQIAGTDGIPTVGPDAVVMNVTVTEPSAAGFITAYPTGSAQPAVSNLNFRAGQTVPNLVTVKVGASGKVTLVNNSPGTVELVADVAGYFLGAIPATE